ncbi:spore germination protein [Lederbergia citrea]|uniref:spore germination protein n=1 Tax=Lederbergia citrea TaxID=2833581 RepID=UPI001BC9833E|nr:spore germination protein [Lederbergia citrea]MBS4205465.1 spore germination protein [Lederbergia citrea]
MSLFFRLKSRNRNGTVKQQQGAEPITAESDVQTSSLDKVKKLDDRLQWYREQLNLCSDVVYHTFVAGPNQHCALIFLQGMIDQKTIQEEVLNNILSLDKSESSKQFCNKIFTLKQFSVTNLNVLTTIQKGLQAILDGHVLLLVNGDHRMIEFPFSSFEKRAIEDAPNETVIRGPREAFIEDLGVNLTLLRRNLKTKKFKTELMEIGAETKTKIIIAYLHGVCEQQLVDEVKMRISQIKIDGVLGSNYIEEYIQDNPYSPFPQIQYTERPDTVSSSLLEGRVAIIVDGTPIVLLAPTTLFSLLQSPEDYFQRFIAGTWIRWIRYLFAFISLLLPSFYIAITTFHPELIPPDLLITIAASREVVPFPAFIEAFIIEVAFEALREAAVRVPKIIGQAVSIIGALIIGTAAVEAGIVSSLMVIIVAVTGISSFLIPQYDLGLAFRLLRFPIMFLAGGFGIFGIVCGMIFLYLHLINLQSFGTPYLSPVAPLDAKKLRDILVRAPWPILKQKPNRYPTKQMNSRKWRIKEEID